MTNSFTVFSHATLDYLCPRKRSVHMFIMSYERRFSEIYFVVEITATHEQRKNRKECVKVQSTVNRIRKWCTGAVTLCNWRFYRVKTFETLKKLNPVMSFLDLRNRRLIVLQLTLKLCPAEPQKLCLLKSTIFKNCDCPCSKISVFSWKLLLTEKCFDPKYIVNWSGSLPSLWRSRVVHDMKRNKI